MRSTTPLVVAALVLTVGGCADAGALVGVHEAPGQVTTAAPIAAANATEIATRVLTMADKAKAAKPEEAKAMRAEALTGAALAVATAADRLDADVRTSTVAPVTRTSPPKVLAVSRGSDWPRIILAQTTGEEGSAVLNLLSSPDARTPFRLEASVRMHPGATVAALDPLPDGSPLTDGFTLPIKPVDLMKQYAASLAYPKPVTAKDVDATDPFATAVRANAVAQAKAFGKLATLTQTHVVDPDRTVTIGLRGGGALVFALMERTDTITLSAGGKSLTPSADFQRLVRKKVLTKNAELKSYETVVLTLPAEGRAKVVGVDEVLFSAKGA